MTKETELFEVIDVKPTERGSFQVEVEIISTRERRTFGYPVHEGWETEINGEMKFISNIRERLLKEELNKKTFDINTISSKVKNKRFKDKKQESEIKATVTPVKKN